jgi:hypothetical protein
MILLPFYLSYLELDIFPGDMMIKNLLRYIHFLFSLLVIISFSTDAKTRFSSVHFVPDADLLFDGEFIVDINSYIIAGDSLGLKVNPGGLLKYSVSKWVNIEAGYTGGFTIGLKTRIFDETKVWMPSCAIGIQNVFTSKEANFYGMSNDKTLTNEIYLALGKSIEPLRLRLHAGIQSIPLNKKERVNPYVAFEKYLGAGLYATAELSRRHGAVIPSAFASWRFWKKRFELSAGVVDILGMFFTEKEITSTVSSTTNVQPGIYAGVRFHGSIGRYGNFSGLMSIEDQLNLQKAQIINLNFEVDSLKSLFMSNYKQLKTVDSSLSAISDSTLKSQNHYRNIVIERLNNLRVFYNQEPFEPELVKKGYLDLVGYRNEIVQSLFDVSFDLSLEKQLRKLAVSVLGELRTTNALDALINILSQSKETDVKIEALIALGKNREVRAVHLIRQLVNDPDDALSFTANEILDKIVSETGLKLSAPDTVNKIPSVIPENKIVKKKSPVNKSADFPVSKKVENENISIQKIETPSFTETTIYPERSAGKGKPDDTSNNVTSNDKKKVLKSDSVSVQSKQLNVIKPEAVNDQRDIKNATTTDNDTSKKTSASVLMSESPNKVTDDNEKKSDIRKRDKRKKDDKKNREKDKNADSGKGTEW